jgi:hypothetical protein
VKGFGGEGGEASQPVDLDGLSIGRSVGWSTTARQRCPVSPDATELKRDIGQMLDVERGG